MLIDIISKDCKVVLKKVVLKKVVLKKVVLKKVVGVGYAKPEQQLAVHKKCHKFVIEMIGKEFNASNLFSIIQRSLKVY